MLLWIFASFLGVGRQFNLLHEMTYLLDFFLEFSSLFLRLLLKRGNLAVCLIPVLISIVSFFDDVCHLFPLFMQLILQLLIEIIKDNPLLSQTVDHQFQFLIHCDGLVELLVGLV